MEAICSSETSVETQRTTRRHIPEDDNLQNHRCKNLKSYIVSFYGEATQRHIRHSAFHLLARWFAEPISSTLKMEAICSSETAVETKSSKPL
jgi:hypothetical protein